MDNNCALYQLGGEHGDFFLNSGPEPMPLINAGISLAKHTHEDYAVRAGTVTLWSSKEAGTVNYRLVRRMGSIDFLILPGAAPEGLIKTGEIIAGLYPEWCLQVQDSELAIIWTNKKSALGQAEDTTQNG